MWYIGYYVLFVHNARGKLTALFVCHRTVIITDAYQMKIKYDQGKFGAIF